MVSEIKTVIDYSQTKETELFWVEIQNDPSTFSQSF